MARDAPNRLPWPPLILAGLLLAGVALEWWVPLVDDTVWPTGAAFAGWAVLIAAIGLMAWSLATMHRARTNILPHRAADRLVTHGPFAISRNPIYLANSGFLLGGGLAFAAPWLMLAAACDVVLVTHLAIRREEAHLAALFPDEWPAYSVRVGRWVGPV